MKNNTISISFYKVYVPVIITLLGALLLFLTLRYANKEINTIVGFLIPPPIMFFFMRQFLPKIEIPRSMIIGYYGFALEMGISPLRGSIGGMQVSSVCGFIICLVATFLIIRKNRGEIKPWLIALYLLIGLSALQVPVRIYDFTGTLISLPDYLMHVLGIAAGFFLYHREKIVQSVNLSISVLLVLFVYFYGYDMWVAKLDYGTFTGKVYKKAPVDIKLTDVNNTAVSLKNGKLTVMDLWFVRCGACFEAFPEFQQYYNKYKSNPNVQFYTVNQPSRGENITESFKMLKDRGYTFPMAAAGHDNAMVKALGIHAFPTTIVIDEQGYVIYEGNTRGAMATVNNLLQGDKPLSE